MIVWSVCECGGVCMFWLALERLKLEVVGDEPGIAESIAAIAFIFKQKGEGIKQNLQHANISSSKPAWAVMEKHGAPAVKELETWAQAWNKRQA